MLIIKSFIANVKSSLNSAIIVMKLVKLFNLSILWILFCFVLKFRHLSKYLMF